MSDNKFYRCSHCGNVIGMIHNAGVPVMCCGQKMDLLEPNTVEASAEKHLPVVEVVDNAVLVSVGEDNHPMEKDHRILWVYLETNKGGHRRVLEEGRDPYATFVLSGEKPIAVYAYCNLHGLWKTEVEEKKACPLTPVKTKATENYPVCLCNKVSYFDILDAIHDNKKMDALLDVFENVKNTTKCSTGCGGCYDKVIHIISEEMY